jgi:maleylpyruvate isomerase
MTDRDFTLFTYFRSSAAFRLRIALNLKGIAPDRKFVHLRKAEQFADDYRALNPQALVPTLIHKGHAIGQSLAAIEYLDEIEPDPPLLPDGALARARVRQIAYALACDIHPINNLRIRNYLSNELHHSDAEVLEWQRHWMRLGFDALEEILVHSKDTGKFCHGDQPTLADICLVPQIANAHGAEMDLTAWPTLARIEKAAYGLPAFRDALPKNQPDAE